MFSCFLDGLQTSAQSFRQDFRSIIPDFCTFGISTSAPLQFFACRFENRICEMSVSVHFEVLSLAVITVKPIEIDYVSRTSIGIAGNPR